MNGCTVLFIMSHSGAFYKSSAFSLFNTGSLKELGFAFFFP